MAQYTLAPPIRRVAHHALALPALATLAAAGTLLALP
jgi:hypothetical protein